MFCFKAGTILDELARHAPDVHRAAEACWALLGHSKEATGSMLEIPAAAFAEVPSISIDYAVMERSDRVAVVPGDFGWSDIGSWNAISGLALPDENNNRSIGEVIFEDCRNSFVQSEDRLVAALGVDNLMVIDTPDALLIMNEGRTQDVKNIVARLKSTGHEAYRLHRTVARPWGTYTVIEVGPRFKIKRIVVKPGASLSLQKHRHRSEHWVVVSGTAQVVNGENNTLVQANQSTYISAGTAHRLSNPGTIDCVMIEVQSGDYLGEDDIVRIEDSYGRI
jgi:mannose-1-phosphate guanylyltransferase/mannose-6-phosphate isomerase